MLADFYIPRISNDRKIVIQKNHLGGEILYRSLDPSKKRHHTLMRRRISSAFERYQNQLFIFVNFDSGNAFI